jgi:hypothetical protein
VKTIVEAELQLVLRAPRAAGITTEPIHIHGSGQANLPFDQTESNPTLRLPRSDATTFQR